MAHTERAYLILISTFSEQTRSEFYRNVPFSNLLFNLHWDEPEGKSMIWRWSLFKNCFKLVVISSSWKVNQTTVDVYFQATLHHVWNVNPTHPRVLPKASWNITFSAAVFSWITLIFSHNLCFCFLAIVKINCCQTCWKNKRTIQNRGALAQNCIVTRDL